MIESESAHLGAKLFSNIDFAFLLSYIALSSVAKCPIFYSDQIFHTQLYSVQCTPQTAEIESILVHKSNENDKKD